jgi:hypothetical protein
MFIVNRDIDTLKQWTAFFFQLPENEIKDNKISECGVQKLQAHSTTISRTV